jgi:hypothetical protein
MINLVETEYEDAMKEAQTWVEGEYDIRMPWGSAKALIETFLENLYSRERDFSDEMLQARKTFRKLTAEQPDECPSKLWDDALASVGRS